MKIYLVQHGEAVPKDIDTDRPLSDRGRRDVAAMAAFLETAGVHVERILHSGKTRARQTAGLIAAKLQVGTQPEAVTGIGPNDPVQPFMAVINDWIADTMVVGHLPFMGRLLACLVCGQDQPSIVSFTPGTVACLEKNDSSQWSLRWILGPEIVK